MTTTDVIKKHRKENITYRLYTVSSMRMSRNNDGQQVWKRALQFLVDGHHHFHSKLKPKLANVSLMIVQTL